MGPPHDSGRAAVRTDQGEGTDVRLHRLERREHGQRGPPHEVVGERPAGRPEIDQTGPVGAVQRGADIGRVAASDADDVGGRGLHAKDGGQRQDVAMFR